MDSSVLAEYFPLFAQGALITLRVSIIGIIAALMIGLVGAVISYLRVPVASQLVAAYVELGRNTPLLVQLFFIYFGLPKLGMVLSSEASAIIGLAFLGGAYMTEALRSGLNAVNQVQWESALSLGFTRLPALHHVVVPQALSIAMPSVVANVIFLIKETSVVSVVALADLVFVAKELIGREYNTNEALGLLVFFYLIILLPVSLFGRWLEGRLRHAQYGA